jgi:hypothetical protein
MAPVARTALDAEVGQRCPHCGAVADVERHSALGFSCLVCGGPRVAIDAPNIVLSSRTLAALESAGREQTKHIMFTAAGLVLAAMGGLALLLATVVVLAASPGLLPTLATYVGASVPLAAGLFALVRAASARTIRADALHTAQVSALGDVQQQLGSLDAAGAARVMRLEPERAELLVAEASVVALLQDAPPPRLRIEGTPPGATEIDVAATEREATATEPTPGTRRDTTEM